MWQDWVWSKEKGTKQVEKEQDLTIDLAGRSVCDIRDNVHQVVECLLADVVAAECVAADVRVGWRYRACQSIKRLCHEMNIFF